MFNLLIGIGLLFIVLMLCFWVGVGVSTIKPAYEDGENGVVFALISGVLFVSAAALTLTAVAGSLMGWWP